MKVDQRNRPPKVIDLYGGRYRVERLSDVTNFLDTKGEIDADVFLAPKTPDKTIATCFIVEQALLGADTAKPNQLKQAFETLTAELVDSERPRSDFELNGLHRITNPKVAFPDFAWKDGLTIGSTAYPSTGEILAGIKDNSDHLATRLTLTWLEPGIIEAEKRFDDDLGVLFVTFRSVGTKFTPTALHPPATLDSDPIVAFQGGAAAAVIRDRIQNVNGYRTYLVTVMLNKDGTALNPAANTEVRAYQDYIQYQKPGDVSFSSSEGFKFFPGGSRDVLVDIKEYVSTTATMPASNAWRPFSVKSWAQALVSFKPEDQDFSTVQSKGATGYLAQQYTGLTGGDYIGVPIDVGVAVAESDPVPDTFYALDGPILSAKNIGQFTADNGTVWHRRRVITLVGTFATALNY